MSIKPSKPSLLALALLALSATAQAQEAAGGTDKERLDRAKQEQAAAEKEAADKAAAEEKAAADKAAAESLAKMGVDPAEAPPEEAKGFFVGVEAFWADVEGGERDIARLGTIVTSATSAETLDTDPVGTAGEGLPDAYTMAGEQVLGLEYDSQVSPIIEIGYRREQGGVFSVRYFSWSSDADLAATSSTTYPSTDPAQGSLILGGLDNQGMEATAANAQAYPEAFARPFGTPAEITGNLLHGADSVTAQGSLELSRIDLMFSRTALATKRFELLYRVGLSLVDATKEESAQFTWRSFDRGRVQLNALSIEDVSASCDTSALGIMGGIGGRFGLSADRRWSFRLGLEVAGLKANKELLFRDVQQYSQDNLVPAPPLTVYQDSKNDDSGDIVTIVDLDAAVEYRFGQRFRVGLGYRQGTYFSVLTSEKYPSGANLAQLESNSVDLDVGGPYLRVGVFF